MMYIGWISNMENAIKASFNGNERQQKRAKELWNTLFIEKIKFPIETWDLQAFIAALKETAYRSPIINERSEKILRDALDIFLPKCSNVEEVKDLYGEYSRLTGIYSNATMLLLKEWDRYCCTELEKAKTPKDEKAILCRSSYLGSMLDHYALHVIKSCDTLKKLSDLKRSINGYTHGDWPRGAPEFEKLYPQKRQELLLKEIEEVSTLEEARALFYLTREEDGALQVSAFEKWIQFCQTKTEFAEAFEEAPKDYLRFLMYEKFREAAIN